MTEIFRLYAQIFFAPTQSLPKSQLIPQNYHIQKNLPPGKNLLSLKNPQVFHKIRAMQVDFENSIAVNESIDPLVSLHKIEDRILKQENLPDMVVSKSVIRMLLDRLASLPRNGVSHPRNRNAIGGYLYGKFGRLGLLTHMMGFQAARPKFGGMSGGVRLKLTTLNARKYCFLSGCCTES